MKKITFFLIVFIWGISMIMKAQIPNNGFENWTAGNPDGWATTNLFPIGLVTITQTSDSHSGNYAVKGDVVNLMGTPMAPAVQSGPEGEGFAISQKYQAFEVYYKFTSVGGDKFSVNVGFEKAGTPIAQGAVALPANVGEYTHLSVPMDYFVDDVPDLANIQISITGPLAGPDVHVGSTMFIDDLAFSMETGLECPVVQTDMLKCFPNPATEVLHLTLDEELSGEILLRVNDNLGNEVRKINTNLRPGENNLQMSIVGLPSGMYYLMVQSKDKYYTGKFSISSR
jgi:hypothetical protein